ncbi:MAG TPA: two-component regulator propeller domain-containing protein, partial [Saprospiraceae bacterium]|nr:two-component regulator propeller domain-containing protein [Saprospiraceae bacterium]
MIRIGRVVALIILCTLWVQGIFAQTDQFKFRHLNISNGLSHHEITTIFKDSRGFIWIGTAFFGLNRFDGNTVKSFLHDAHDTTSLINNSINQVFETPDLEIGVLTPAGVTLFNPESERFERNLDSFYEKYGTSKHLKNIVRDRDGAFWFIESHRVMKYIPSDGKSIVFKNIVGDTTSIVQDSISDFSIAKNGNRWIVHSNGIAERLEEVSGRGQVKQRIYHVYNFNKGHQTSYQLLADMDGDLWFRAAGLDQGVFYYDLKDEKLHPVTTNSPSLRLNTNAASCFVEADDGAIWIGTDHGGINIVDKKQSTVRYIYHRPDDAMSVSESSIKCFHRDDQGIIWAGTYKRGVSYYHKNIYRFDVYRRHSLDAGSLPFEDINRFAEDDNGNLWIGTNGGGLLYFDRRTGQYKQYLNEPKNEKSLSGNVIVSLCIDAEKNLWIGTYLEGLNKFDGKKFTRYKHVPGDTSSLPSQNVWEVFEDSRGRLWIGTLNEGLALLDRRTDKFQRIKTWGPNAMQSMTIDAITEDRHGNIWFGTANGIDVLSPDAKNFTHFEASSNPYSLSNNGILDIREDSKGRIWVATMDGLNLFDESLRGFRVYKENLPHKAALTIQEDNLGRIWIGTLNGLCEMTMLNDDPTDVSFKRYIESDGLQGLQFNLNASLKTQRGELVFGGPTGFNIFSAEKPGEDLPVPRVIFSDLRLYQKSVGIGEKIDGVVVLNKSISEATEIVLPPNKNSFSIKFSALEYFNPEKNQYLYKLEDLNSEWLPVESKNHEIIFNSLNPGQYKLRVKAANIDGIWSDNDAVLSITVQPPFWKTNIAFMLYAFLLMGMLFVARRVIQQREQLKFALEQERREIQRVHEMDMMKVKFFTNVSHEFRTPLTLIITPMERLIKRATDPDQIVQFQLIQRNGKRLMSLVNQLLDFKKL